jgi:hypothetical protein
LAIRAVVIALAGTCLAQPIATADDQPRPARVRSTDPFLAALIERAATQSGTFRRLLVTIERTNGMVQIEPGVCGHSVRACLKMWMETTVSYRFLRVAIDRRNGDSDIEVMASMGHELQHAIEALSESRVTDGTRLYNFFRRFAPTDGDRFETTDAIHTGDAVRNELSGR